MARTKGTGRGVSARITLRFDPLELAYYGKRAQAAGVSTSAFMRQCLVEGMIAQSVEDIELRLTALMQKIPSTTESGKGGGLCEDALLSIFTSEALLTAIVEARSPQELYAAQDRAKKRVLKVRMGQT